MEYMRSTSVAQSSSNPYIDGVPFKVSDANKPPTKVSLPLTFQMPNPVDILSEMYDFTLEHAVLNYAEAQREAEEELDLSREENNRQSQTDTDDMSPHAPENTELQNEPDNQIRTTASDYSHQNGPVGHTETVNPLLANISSDILTPVPIARKQNSGNPDENGTTQNARINLADFENEQDPFDNITLQTINDREELRNLFSASGVSSKPVTNGVDHNYEGNTNNSNIHTNNGHIKQNGDKDIEDESVGVTLQTSGGRVSYKPSVRQNTKITKEDELEPMRQKRKSFPESQIPKLPPLGAAPTLTTSPLPPIWSRSKTQLQDSVAPHSDLGFREPSAISSWDSSLPKHIPTGRYSRHDSAIHESLNLENTTTTSGFGSSSQGTSFQDSLRSSRSTPDISQLERTSLSPYLTTVSPPSRPSSGQSWNRYSPLPSTPKTSSPPRQPVLNRVPPPRPAPPRERNPYSELSNESQGLVNNVASMGFPQARVARAVEKLGIDDKQVVDHLCKLSSMLDSGFSAVDAEDALFSFPEQDTKVKEYLELLTYFKQMGFAPVKVKEALINHNCDKDKALDQLTQS